MLFVVVVPAVLVNLADTKEPLKHVQALDALGTLSYCKRVTHLESGSISPPLWSVRLSHEVDRKASLSVDKTSDPADQSFLLIVRIRRIVTVRLANAGRRLLVERVPRHTRIFQHLARFY